MCDLYCTYVAMHILYIHIILEKQYSNGYDPVPGNRDGKYVSTYAHTYISKH